MKFCSLLVFIPVTRNKAIIQVRVFEGYQVKLILTFFLLIQKRNVVLYNPIRQVAFCTIYEEKSFLEDYTIVYFAGNKSYWRISLFSQVENYKTGKRLVFLAEICKSQLIKKILANTYRHAFHQSSLHVCNCPCKAFRKL